MKNNRKYIMIIVLLLFVAIGLLLSLPKATLPTSLQYESFPQPTSSEYLETYSFIAKYPNLHQAIRDYREEVRHQTDCWPSKKYCEFFSEDELQFLKSFGLTFTDDVFGELGTAFSSDGEEYWWPIVHIDDEQLSVIIYTDYRLGNLHLLYKEGNKTIDKSLAFYLHDPFSFNPEKGEVILDRSWADTTVFYPENGYIVEWSWGTQIESFYCIPKGFTYVGCEYPKEGGIIYYFVRGKEIIKVHSIDLWTG